jgi:glutaredoxin
LLKTYENKPGDNMKKILSIVIIGFFVLYGFGAVALNNENTKSSIGDEQRNAFTHTIFAEDATATWCGYCHYAREALDKIYTSGDYPFYYTCMVDDKNTHAAARNNEYNIYGFPTVFFDGGYKVAVGGGTGNEAQYKSYITQCGSRTVKDIDITLEVEWLGNAKMDITASVKNNETTQYNGRIRVYVTEVVSSMSWLDTTGHPYTFPFLDYAFNQVISISAGNTWSNSINWDGHNYNDGYGHNFGNIQFGNIMIIAVVFNSEWHQGYAYPPNSNPFDAYYVDDATGFFVGPPNTPSDPDPADGATDINLNTDLSWSGGPGSSITYDIYFGTNSDLPLIVSNQSGTTYDPGTMEYDSTYYWKIVAWDPKGNSAEGPIWEFSTVHEPNYPPTAPEISGQSTGKTGTNYEYTLASTDPNQDKLYYYVSWGDGTNTDWTGPYNSGEQVILNHTWSKTGTYKISAKAKDEHGASSSYSTLDVTMPRMKTQTNPLLLKILERLLYYFPVLKQILRM